MAQFPIIWTVLALQTLGILFIYSVSSLVTVPVPDDLIGPGQCPTGSFCIETGYCTNEFYTTKSGMPFYCGPTHQIDSMICCISTNPVPPVAQTSPPHGQEQTDDMDPFEYNDLEELVRTNRSVVEEGDVDTLSLPITAKEIDGNHFDDLALPDPNAELEGHIETPRDLEALIEDAIEQELISELASGANVEAEETLNDAMMETLGDLAEQIESDIESNAVKEALPMESRANSAVRPSTHTLCPCEKGEPGPKGDPGEPGKIIYVPVFVASGGSPPPLGPAPLPFNPQTLYAHLGQNQGQQVPQHPNPTMIPYNVPISVPPGNSPPLHAPPVTPVPHPHQPQFPQQAPMQMQPPQTQPSMNPFVDNLQERLTRHAAGEQRRYHGRRAI